MFLAIMGKEKKKKRQQKSVCHIMFLAIILYHILFILCLYRGYDILRLLYTVFLACVVTTSTPTGLLKNNFFLFLNCFLKKWTCDMVVSGDSEDKMGKEKKRKEKQKRTCDMAVSGDSENKIDSDNKIDSLFDDSRAKEGRERKKKGGRKKKKRPTT